MEDQTALSKFCPNGNIHVYELDYPPYSKVPKINSDGAVNPSHSETAFPVSVYMHVVNNNGESGQAKGDPFYVTLTSSEASDGRVVLFKLLQKMSIITQCRQVEELTQSMRGLEADLETFEPYVPFTPFVAYRSTSKPCVGASLNTGVSVFKREKQIEASESLRSSFSSDRSQFSSSSFNYSYGFPDSEKDDSSFLNYSGMPICGTNGDFSSSSESSSSSKDSNMGRIFDKTYTQTFEKGISATKERYRFAKAETQQDAQKSASSFFLRHQMSFLRQELDRGIDKSLVAKKKQFEVELETSNKDANRFKTRHSQGLLGGSPESVHQKTHDHLGKNEIKQNLTLGPKSENNSDNESIQSAAIEKKRYGDDKLENVESFDESNNDICSIYEKYQDESVDQSDDDIFSIYEKYEDYESENNNLKRMYQSQSKNSLLCDTDTLSLDGLGDNGFIYVPDCLSKNNKSSKLEESDDAISCDKYLQLEKNKLDSTNDLSTNTSQFSQDDSYNDCNMRDPLDFNNEWIVGPSGLLTIKMKRDWYEANIEPTVMDKDYDWVIPNEAARIRKRRQEGNSRENVVTLEDCLELFSETEDLGDKNLWHCAQCKKQVEASKTIEL